MALKGLTKADQVHSKTDKRIEAFISGSNGRVQNLQPSQKKFQRFTFSLTEDISREIDQLVVESRVAKANRSIILKAALRQLQMLSSDELQAAILEEIS